MEPDLKGRSGPVRDLAVIAILALAYYGSARLGQILAIPPGNVTAIWPPSGIALAAVLLFGSRVWPGIALGGFAGDIWPIFDGSSAAAAARSIATVAGMEAGVVIEILVLAYLIRRYIGFPYPFASARSVLVFILLIGSLSALIGATWGVGSLYLGGFMVKGELATAWLTWWLGDSVGMLLVAPLVLACSRPSEIRIKRLLEAIPFFVLVALTDEVIFDSILDGMGTFHTDTTMYLPLLMFAVFRWGQAGTVASAFFISVKEVYDLVHILRIDPGADTYAPVLMLQVFLAIISVSSLLLSAVLLDLERKNKAFVQEEFLNLISHELRAPLATMLGSANLLRDEVLGPINERQSRQVGTMMASMGRFRNLVNDLVEMSKLQNGRFTIVARPMNFSRVIEETLEMVAPLAEQKPIRLVNELHEAPLEVVADEQRIGQILVNLFTNAIRFTPTGTVRVRAWVEGDRLCCEVEDSGRGIASEEIPKLFQRFSQVGVERHQGGLGLGLSICKHLVEAHGGTIGVRSEPGKGSTFWFMLPLQPPSSVASLSVANGGPVY